MTTSHANLFRLDHQQFVVVGAGNGLGRETATTLSALGAHVLCVDIDDRRATQIADDVGGEPCVADATDADGIARITSACWEMGGVDGLADIVGLSQFGALRDATDEALDAQLRINLHHVFRLLRAAPDLLRDGPNRAMVFIASALGLTGAPNQALYGAAKAAVVSLVRSAALELAPVRVNAVAPGVIATPRVSGYMPPAALATFEANAPLGRIGHPIDIAGAVAFLLGSAAAYVSGQTLLVDGGVSAKPGYPDMPGR